MHGEVSGAATFLIVALLRKRRYDVSPHRVQLPGGARQVPRLREPRGAARTHRTHPRRRANSGGGAARAGTSPGGGGGRRSFRRRARGGSVVPAPFRWARLWCEGAEGRSVRGPLGCAGGAGPGHA